MVSLLIYGLIYIYSGIIILIKWLLWPTGFPIRVDIARPVSLRIGKHQCNNVLVLHYCRVTNCSNHIITGLFSSSFLFLRPIMAIQWRPISMKIACDWPISRECLSLEAEHIWVKCFFSRLQDTVWWSPENYLLPLYGVMNQFRDILSLLKFLSDRTSPLRWSFTVSHMRPFESQLWL